MTLKTNATKYYRNILKNRMIQIIILIIKLTYYINIPLAFIQVILQWVYVILVVLHISE